MKSKTEKQIQKSGSDSQNIQSGRDTVIQKGLTPKDLHEILEVIRTQMAEYTATAREIVDSRLVNFENQLLKKFSESGTANPTAFQDPDFQYLLSKGLHAYARSGDRNVGEILIDLIAERSKVETRNRLALTLNKAVEVSAYLTPNEFAELSLKFLIGHSINYGINSIYEFTEYFAKFISPLLGDVSMEESSYQYLASLGCGNVSIMSLNPFKAFTNHYGGIFSLGFSLDEFNLNLKQDNNKLLDALSEKGIIIPCHLDRKKFQIKSISKNQFVEDIEEIKISDEEIEKIWKYFSTTFWGKPEFLNNLSPKLPEIQLLANIWDQTSIGKFQLSAVGIAIGYSNVQRYADLGADLKIWLK